VIVLVSALVAGVLIGFVIGSAISNGRAEDTIKRLRLDFLEHDAVHRMDLALHASEMRALKYELGSQMRARAIATEQPAGWSPETAPGPHTT
jgi:hypothetical protein